MNMRRPLQTCGNSYDEWDANGCRDGGDVLDQCEQCTEWEANHWDAVERG
jgi:hypothetical protein